MFAGELSGEHYDVLLFSAFFSTLMFMKSAEFHSTPKDYYRQKYFEAMDNIVQAITDRFDQEDFCSISRHETTA
jgi:hypothetical protein